MIIAARNMLIILFGAIIVFLLPFLVMPMLGQPPVGALLVPLVLVFEVIAYFLYVSIGKETTETLPFMICGALTALFRFVVSLTGALYLAALGRGGVGGNLLNLWVGYPLSVLLQMGVLLLLLPHVIVLVAPGMLAEASREKMESAPRLAPQLSSQSAAAIHTDAIPLGGFVRAYNYEELENFFQKIVGLEGFVLFSDEGLVVWKNLQMRLDVDALVVRYQMLDRQMGNLTRQSGLQKVQRWVVQTREHIICCTALGSQFYLLVFFTTQLSLADIVSKLDVIVRTAQEMLNTRYGASWAA
jgi:predicted regulator of Ras-like GTPase activity (Roadblock/LC7/MglB family)